MGQVAVKKLLANDTFFEKLKGWMRPQEVADAFGVSVWTIYKWKHKGKLMGIPEDLFVKFGGSLFLRKEVLQRWMSSNGGNIS